MKLLFVLTFKGSLEKWMREGIANREMEIYFEYLRRNLFSHIQIFSYAPNDKFFLDTLNFDPALKERIELIMPDGPCRSLADYIRHSFNILKIRAAIKNGAVLCKTNQINGSWTAILARFLGCPLFIRCGYLLSRRHFKEKEYLKSIISLAVEVVGFNLASFASITTENERAYASKMMITDKKRIFVAPTYVNTNIFHAPVTQKLKNRSFLFVGRLESQKNPFAMLEACRIANVPLTIVGKGSLENELIDCAQKTSVQLTHHPSLMNEEIAELFKTHRYFLLPSLHEGLPKVLIEAMAGEMICVGTPTSGITDLIFPGKTGYLAKDFSAASIAEAIKTALEDPSAETYAQAARTFVLERHSITAYVDREQEKMASVLEQNPVG